MICSTDSSNLASLGFLEIGILAFGVGTNGGWFVEPTVRMVVRGSAVETGTVPCGALVLLIVGPLVGILFVPSGAGDGLGSGLGDGIGEGDGVLCGTIGLPLGTENAPTCDGVDSVDSLPGTGVTSIGPSLLLRFTVTTFGRPFGISPSRCGTAVKDVFISVFEGVPGTAGTAALTTRSGVVTVVSPGAGFPALTAALLSSSCSISLYAGCCSIGPLAKMLVFLMYCIICLICVSPPS